MANIKVKDLTDTASITITDEMMVLTDSNTNLVQNITVGDLLTNIISSDGDNVITQGTDNKLFVEDLSGNIGNLANLTTTNKTSLVDAINEVDGDIGDLSNLTTTARNSVVSAINEVDGDIGDLSNLTTADKSSIVNAINDAVGSTLNGANTDLSNLTTNGESRLHALKGYLDEGEILTDSEGLADVIKYAHSSFDASKFTVVGSPVITSDGIASGFSNSSHIEKTLSISSNSNYIIKGSFTTSSTVNQFQQVCLLLNDTTTIIALLINNVDNRLVFNYRKNNATSIVATAINSIQPNTEYNYTIVVSGTSLTFKINNVEISTVSFDGNAIDKLISGTSRDGSNAFLGSIDLKQFSITVDGVPVFSGNKTGTDTYTIGGNSVLIPYTLSKTDSKIVDSSYRAYITALYNQQGYAPYYTLDEGNGNFTLPAGEIYGMMLNQSVPHIIETYSNGNSEYRLWSDGWCEQWGYSQENASISLLKEYKTATYSIFLTRTTTETAGYAATIYEQNTDSFTFQISNDLVGDSYAYWKTEGYIV